MGFRLREIEAESKFSRELDVKAIGRVVPKSEVEAAIATEGVKEKRERKLNMVVVIFLLIAINIYTYISMGAVMRKIAKGLRFIWPNPDYPVPKDSAISYRRYQLGARPVVALFHQVCQPMATPETQGAFLFGLRLMAIDGTTEDAPDTPENDAAFGRHTGGRGESAFPQVRGVYLVECGTHAIVDAGFWPCHVSEYVGARRMLRSVEPEMLVMWDAGLHDYDMIAEVMQRGSHVL